VTKLNLSSCNSWY